MLVTFKNMGGSSGVELKKLLDALAMTDALPEVKTGGMCDFLPQSRTVAKTR